MSLDGQHSFLLTFPNFFGMVEKVQPKEEVKEELPKPKPKVVKKKKRKLKLRELCKWGIEAWCVEANTEKCKL